MIDIARQACLSPTKNNQACKRYTKVYRYASRFGRGAERLSEAKMRAPNKPTPNKEIFLYLKSIKIEEAIPAKKTKKTYDNNPALFPSSFNRNPSFYFLNIGIILFLT